MAAWVRTLMSTTTIAGKQLGVLATDVLQQRGGHAVKAEDHDLGARAWPCIETRASVAGAS